MNLDMDVIHHNQANEDAEIQYTEVLERVTITLRCIHQVRQECLGLEMQLKDIVNKFNERVKKIPEEFKI